MKTGEKRGRPKGGSVAAADGPRILELIRAGKTVREVAEATGRHPSVIYNVLKRLGNPATGAAPEPVLAKERNLKLDLMLLSIHGKILRALGAGALFPEKIASAVKESVGQVYQAGGDLIRQGVIRRNEGGHWSLTVDLRELEAAVL